jgi:hypothetical protein
MSPTDAHVAPDVVHRRPWQLPEQAIAVARTDVAERRAARAERRALAGGRRCCCNAFAVDGTCDANGLAVRTRCTCGRRTRRLQQAVDTVQAPPRRRARALVDGADLRDRVALAGAATVVGEACLPRAAAAQRRRGQRARTPRRARRAGRPGRTRAGRARAGSARRAGTGCARCAGAARRTSGAPPRSAPPAPVMPATPLASAPAAAETVARRARRAGVAADARSRPRRRCR